MTYNGCYNAKFTKFFKTQNLYKTIQNRRIDDVLVGDCFQIVYKHY
jgi:hypothetical protein